MRRHLLAAALVFTASPAWAADLTPESCRALIISASKAVAATGGVLSAVGQGVQATEAKAIKIGVAADLAPQLQRVVDDTARAVGVLSKEHEGLRQAIERACL